MVADFKLTAGGADITGKIAKNLISLQFSDKEGSQSDELSFTLHGLFSAPEFGQEFELELGYKGGKMHKCGKFSFAECSKDYVAHTTEIKATAVNFSAPIKIKKSRTYANTTLAAIAQTVAKDNNLRAKVQPAAASVAIAHEVQDNLSDMDFFYRLCFKHGFICAIKNGALVVTEKTAAMDGYAISGGSGKSSAPALPRAKMSVKDCYSLQITESNRVKYDACEFSSQDTKSARAVKVKVGNGENVAKIKAAPNKSAAELQSLARAKLSELNKGGIKGRLSCAGRAIYAGAVLELEGIGDFSIKSVNHSLDASGYVVDVEFEG